MTCSEDEVRDIWEGQRLVWVVVPPDAWTAGSRHAIKECEEAQFERHAFRTSSLDGDVGLCCRN